MNLAIPHQIYSRIFAASTSNVTVVEKLQELHTQVYALRLQGRRIDGEDLSDEERQFLKLVLKEVERTTPLDASDPTKEVNVENVLILANDFYQQGRIERAKGERGKSIDKFKESIRHFERVISKNPNNTSTFARLARAQLYAGEWQQSMATFRKIINIYGEDNNRSYGSLIGLGLSELMTGGYEAAVSSFRKSAELVGTDAEKAGALENIGLVYLRKGNWGAAFANSMAVNDIFPEHAWNWLIQAIAADKLGIKNTSSNAHIVWRKRASKQDKLSMQIYLPTELQSYIESLP